MNDDYTKQLELLTKGITKTGIPDKVKKYTHDINGKKLPCEYVQLNEQYVHHLNKIPQHIEAKNDYFALCFGYPGAGKSHLLQRTALYLNAEFSLEDISFTTSQLDDWIRDAKPGSVGIFDEADAMAGNHYDNILKSLVRNLQRIRTKRLILFFATPTMRDMHHYFAFRAKMVIYCYVPKNTKPDNRGWIHLWHDQDLISDLFARMKRAYSENSTVYSTAYSTLKNKYNGRSVPEDWPIDEKEYEKKKEEGRRDLEEEGGLTAKQAVNKARNEFIWKLSRLMEAEGVKINQKNIANVFELSRTRYSEILNDMPGRI